MSEALGRYRRLYPRLWREPKFRKLSVAARELTLYLLTGPQTNRIGLFAFSVLTAADDLMMTPAAVRRALRSILDAFGWSFDQDARVFYIGSWWRWNPPDHARVLTGNLKDLADVPCSPLVDTFAAHDKHLGPELKPILREIAGRRLGTLTVISPEAQTELTLTLKEAHGELPLTSREAPPSQEQEQEKEQEKSDVRTSTDRSGPAATSDGTEIPADESPEDAERAYLTAKALALDVWRSQPDIDVMAHISAVRQRAAEQNIRVGEEWLGLAVTRCRTH